MYWYNVCSGLHYGYMFRPQTVIIRPIKNILFKVQKSSSQWNPISFTVEYKIIYEEIPINRYY